MRVLSLLFAVGAFAGTVAGTPHLRRRLQTSDADVPMDPGNLDPANIDPSTLTGPETPDVDPDSVDHLDGTFSDHRFFRHTETNQNVLCPFDDVCCC